MTFSLYTVPLLVVLVAYFGRNTQDVVSRHVKIEDSRLYFYFYSYFFLFSY